MSHRYTKSTNPFDEDQDDDEEIDDETFLKNSRRTYYQNNNNNNATNPTIDQPNFEQQLQTFQQRKRAIEERTINSTEKSLNILRDSEQIGIATAEELMRQREKLEKTDRQLDEINATLRFSQKHINGIKSVFSSLKNYMSGRNENNPTTNQVGGATTTTTTTTNNQSTPTNSGRSTSIPSNDLDEKLSNYDRYENHPATRLRNQVDYSTSSTTGQQQSASKDFSARLDANLQEMCTNISRLKGLAIDMSTEIDSQNDLIGTIIDKTETADMTITKQNKDMNKILKK